MSETIGPYRLLQPIGEGGMARVFAAVHERLERRVALKILSPESAEDPQIVARFLQEARVLEQLVHRGIVRVYDCGRLEDGTAYLAMELLEGKAFDVWLREHDGRVPLDTSLAICGQIADAMVEVHQRGIVHRDLKPSNIIMVPDSNAPLRYRPIVVDFGIAKMPPSKEANHLHTNIATAEHSVLGTAAYMAPEQCTNASEVTVQADVYALGLILFELLAARPPFASSDPIQLLLHHVNTAPPPLCELAPAAPPLLCTFVASMLTKAPEARPTMSRCRDMLARPWASEEAHCPFPGLQPFAEAQAELFFGRESEVRDVVALLEGMREGGCRRWLQIEGFSGAGKSSLVQAGVLPQLPEQSWIVAVFRPSADPIGNLSRALVTAYARHSFTMSVQEVETALRSDGGSILDLIEGCHPRATTLLLVIEQIEEMFALGGAQIAQLDALLSRALIEPTSALRLLTTLRSDYFHRLEQAPQLAHVLNSTASRYHLHPMREDSLARVVLGMAARAGLRLSGDLPERIVRDAASAGGPLPLLGHALRSLWSARSGVELTLREYERMGGVSGALAHEATLLLDGLGAEGRERAKWLILDLVQVGRGAPDTRRPKTRGDVLTAAGGDSKAEEVLARLSAMPLSTSLGAVTEPLRLIVLSGDTEDPLRQRVDLVHEALLQRVPVILAWIDGERALLERHADLEVAAHAWEQAGSPAVGLPSGALLRHYRGYSGDLDRRERFHRMTSGRARRFLDSAEKLEQRRLRRRNGFIGALVVAAVATSISAFVAQDERRRAEESLETFISTTDDIVSDADWQLGRVAYTVDTRREMLNSIERNLSVLQHRGRPEVRRALIRAKHRRSDLARQNETLTGALHLIEEARGMIDADLKGAPTDRELRKLLALNISKRGKISLAVGRYADARADFTASVTLLASMGNLDGADDRRTLATSYSEQADAELELGRFADAERLYDEAVRLLERNPETTSGYDRALLASTLASQADAARKQGILSAAARALERAEGIQGKLTREQPGNSLYQLYLGRIYTSLAALRAEEHRALEADRLYARAIDIGVALHRGDPTQKEYGMLLYQSLIGAEVTAGAKGDAMGRQRAREQRCELARGFLAQDPEDSRFGRPACP